MKNSNTNFIERIIYINLSERTDRKLFMETQLKKFPIKYERFNAVKPTHGQILPNGKFYSFFSRMVLKQRNWPIKRLIGVMGCYLSHFFIHKLASDNNWGNYLILEDDCIFDKPTFYRLKHIYYGNLLNKEWDMFRSTWHSSNIVRKINRPNKKSVFVNENESVNDFCGGTNFQFCNGNSTLKILEYLKKEFVYNIDSVYSTTQLNVYHSKIASCESGMGSDIKKRG